LLYIANLFFNIVLAILIEITASWIFFF